MGSNPHIPSWIVNSISNMRYQQIFAQQQTTLQSLASEFNLPRPQFSSTDGDLKNYIKFVSSFETNIANKGHDDDTAVYWGGT